MSLFRYSMLTALAASLLMAGNAFAEENAAATDEAQQEAVAAAIGEPAPQFELTNVVTGESVALSDFADKTVIVTWQSINCPWNVFKQDSAYERVLYPLAKEWAANDVVFIAINSNNDESAEEIASYAVEHQTPYPVLKDPGNIIADAYGAQTTPHFFVIAPGEEQVLVYMGGFEQVPGSPEEAGQMQEAYLKPVIAAQLAGEELPYTETLSKGCAIKRVSE